MINIFKELNKLCILQIEQNTKNANNKKEIENTQLKIKMYENCLKKIQGNEQKWKKQF